MGPSDGSTAKKCKMLVHELQSDLRGSMVHTNHCEWWKEATKMHKNNDNTTKLHNSTLDFYHLSLNVLSVIKNRQANASGDPSCLCWVLWIRSDANI